MYLSMTQYILFITKTQKSPGFQTLVSAQEQQVTFLPAPWGVCEQNDDKDKGNFNQLRTKKY